MFRELLKPEVVAEIEKARIPCTVVFNVAGFKGFPFIKSVKISCAIVSDTGLLLKNIGDFEIEAGRCLEIKNLYTCLTLP